MELLDFQLKHNGEWMPFSLPIARDAVEDMRARWRAWLKANPSMYDGSESVGACLSVVGNDAVAKWSGFDKIVLGRLIVSDKRSVRF